MEKNQEKQDETTKFWLNDTTCNSKIESWWKFFVSDSLCSPNSPGRWGTGDVSTAAVNAAIESMAAVTAPATFDLGAIVKKSDAMNWDGSMHFNVLLVDDDDDDDDDDDVGTWQNGFDVLEVLTRES